MSLSRRVVRASINGDIWAFRCVLYEMLTGRLGVSGETVSDTLVNSRA